MWMWIYIIQHPIKEKVTDVREKIMSFLLFSLLGASDFDHVTVCVCEPTVFIHSHTIFLSEEGVFVFIHRAQITNVKKTSFHDIQHHTSPVSSLIERQRYDDTYSRTISVPDRTLQDPPNLYNAHFFLCVYNMKVNKKEQQTIVIFFWRLHHVCICSSYLHKRQKILPRKFNDAHKGRTHTWNHQVLIIKCYIYIWEKTSQH